MTQEELGALYERYGYLVRRRCLAITGNAQDADDALQDTFMRVQRYPPAEVRSMLAYLYGIAFRVSCDLLKKRKRAAPLPGETPAREHSVTPGTSETRLTLGAELMKLDPTTRDIAVLHHLDGLTQEEIAERVGYSRKTVGVKLKAAEEKLRRALGSEVVP